MFSIHNLNKNNSFSYSLKQFPYMVSFKVFLNQNTGFFHLGKLLEFNLTEKIFKNPDNKMTQDYITGRFG